MQLEVSTVENAFLRATFLPLLVLSIFLNITLIVWTPSAQAQVSSFENAGGAKSLGPCSWRPTNGQRPKLR